MQLRTTLGLVVLSVVTGTGCVSGQMAGFPDPTVQQTYVLHRSSSRELTGANADARTVTPGQTLTVLDADGPGEVSHIWFTIDDSEPYMLKRIVLRMYWDGETTPSVEAPIGDFYGLGTGEYFAWQSAPLEVGSDKAMNCWFRMPYAKHARITVTNEGKEKVSSLYWNIDYRSMKALPAGSLYFHAQYRQAQPNHGWSNDWYENGDPKVNYRRNLDGKDNFVWVEAQGHGQFVGVTMSVLQNQDAWWGEGNDRFEVDGRPAEEGTGGEDYFLGAWAFNAAQVFPLHGSPVVGKQVAGARQSMYRFHLDSPMPFERSFKASMEHGHANVRSDNFYSVAYWYQAEPHAPFPPLPEMNLRIPALQMVGGPGNEPSPIKPGDPSTR